MLVAKLRPDVIYLHLDRGVGHTVRKLRDSESKILPFGVL